MALVLGVVALVALVVGVAVVLNLGARQARDEQGPTSEPGDFVAPVSSGQFRWRAADETPEQFHARVQREESEAAAASRRG
jgi:cytoskeletal protein RodZ